MMWRRPTEGDKSKRKVLARSEFEREPFFVQWNAEYDCWGLATAPHILVRVQHVWGNAENEY